jgi:cytochrome d ubiquinol oxidase subunit I
MRTADSASPLAAPAVGASLVAFVIVYFAVFGMGAWYLLRLMSRAPQPHEPEPVNAPAHAAGITPGAALAAAPAVGGGNG